MKGVGGQTNAQSACGGQATPEADKAWASPTRASRGGVRPIYVILPNEANFPGCLIVWIILMNKVLEAQVRRFGTWLRLPELASFCGVVRALRGNYSRKEALASSAFPARGAFQTRERSTELTASAAR